MTLPQWQSTTTHTTIWWRRLPLKNVRYVENITASDNKRSKKSDSILMLWNVSEINLWNLNSVLCFTFDVKHCAKIWQINTFWPFFFSPFVSFIKDCSFCVPQIPHSFSFSFFSSISFYVGTCCHFTFWCPGRPGKIMHRLLKKNIKFVKLL